MRWPLTPRCAAVALVALSLGGFWANMSEAQTNNNNNNNNTDGAGSGGVLVSPEGVLMRRTTPDLSGQLMNQRRAAALSQLPNDLARVSPLRKVSLNRLEEAIVARQGVVTDEMRNLAGLQRLQFVFFYPETNDIVIAGPAQGWMSTPTGNTVGIQNGRPTLQLEDLIVALRAYPPQGDATPVIGCSIDPTQEGLAQMQAFLQQVGRYITPADGPRLVNGLRQSLGMHEITVNGVPADTRFAQVLVEADYRMKLIGIGLENPPVQLTRFIDVVNPGQVSSNALFRWYFVPDYQCVRVAEDGLGMELVGDGVKLVGEDEVISTAGTRSGTGASGTASKAFTTSFTRSYPELARRSNVFAELRNLVDMSVAAAYIQKEGLYAKADWDMEFLGDETRYPVRKYNAPKYVESAVNAVMKSGRLATPIGGGVHIAPDLPLDPRNLLADENGKVAALREKVAPQLQEGQWWWD